MRCIAGVPKDLKVLAVLPGEVRKASQALLRAREKSCQVGWETDVGHSVVWGRGGACLELCDEGKLIPVKECLGAACRESIRELRKTRRETVCGKLLLNSGEGLRFYLVRISSVLDSPVTESTTVERVIMGVAILMSWSASSGERKL